MSGLRNSRKSASAPAAPWLHAAAKPRFCAFRITLSGADAEHVSPSAEPSAEALSTTVTRARDTSSFEIAANEARHSCSCRPEFQLTITTWMVGRSIDPDTRLVQLPSG